MCRLAHCRAGRRRAPARGGGNDGRRCKRVAVGGRATLFGAVLGALSVNYAKTWFTAAFPEIWLFALGGLFVLVTLLMPKGMAGLFGNRRKQEQ